MVIENINRKDGVKFSLFELIIFKVNVFGIWKLNDFLMDIFEFFLSFIWKKRGKEEYILWMISGMVYGEGKIYGICLVILFCVEKWIEGGNFGICFW